MSPHKAEGRLIGTILVITAVSCLVAALTDMVAHGPVPPDYLLRAGS